jgi:hypothetical protein
LLVGFVVSRCTTPTAVRVGALAQIGFDNLPQKIAGLAGFGVSFVGLGHERQSVWVIGEPPASARAQPALYERRLHFSGGSFCFVK